MQNRRRNRKGDRCMRIRNCLVLEWQIILVCGLDITSIPVRNKWWRLSSKGDTIACIVSIQCARLLFSPYISICLANWLIIGLVVSVRMQCDSRYLSDWTRGLMFGTITIHPARVLPSHVLYYMEAYGSMTSWIHDFLSFSSLIFLVEDLPPILVTLVCSGIGTRK